MGPTDAEDRARLLAELTELDPEEAEALEAVSADNALDEAAAELGELMHRLPFDDWPDKIAFFTEFVFGAVLDAFPDEDEHALYAVMVGTLSESLVVSGAPSHQVAALMRRLAGEVQTYRRDDGPA